MKNRFLKLISVAAFVVFAMAIQIQVFAQDKSEEDLTTDQQEFDLIDSGVGSKAIEGVWDARVTIINCDTGNPIAMFRAMDMFHNGGTFTDTNAAPPNTRGPGFGTWEYLGRRQFNAVLRFFLYNPDGSFAGVRRIAQDIRLNRSGDEWESTVAITVFDPAGNQISTACATATATRFE